MLNVKDAQIDRLVQHMGHHMDIHKNIYRLPSSVAEITIVSKLLMTAIDNENEKDTTTN